MIWLLNHISAYCCHGYFVVLNRQQKGTVGLKCFSCPVNGREEMYDLETAAEDRSLDSMDRYRKTRGKIS